MKTTTKTRSATTKSKPRSVGSTRKTTPATSAKSPVEDVAATSQGHDEVAEIAYFIYQDRISHGIPGDEVSDWIAAEAAILERSEVGLAV